MVILDVPTCSNTWGKSYGSCHVKVKLGYVKRSSAIKSEGKTVGVASSGCGEALSLKIKNPCRCTFGEFVG